MGETRGMRRLTGTILIALATTSVTGAPGARASVIASEYFSYTAGSSIVGQSGGTGWSGAWANANSAFGDMTIGAASLSYTGLPGAGGDGQGIAGGRGSGAADGRALAAASNTHGSVVWLAFLGAFSSSGGGFPNLRLYDNTTLGEGIGGNNSYSNWALLDSSLTATTFTSTPLNGATDLALLRIDYAGGTSALWMNPAIASFNGTETPSMTLAGAPVFNDVQFFLRAGDNVDALTLATTYQEALQQPAPAPAPAPAPVPEPASGLLMGSFLLGLAGLRRRGAAAPA